MLYLQSSDEAPTLSCSVIPPASVWVFDFFCCVFFLSEVAAFCDKIRFLLFSVLLCVLLVSLHTTVSVLFSLL